MFPRDNKTIVLPFHEDTYDELLDKKVAYKAELNAYIEAYPELFPETIRDGWSLNVVELRKLTIHNLQFTIDNSSF